MGRGMGELKRAGDIAAGEDVRVARLQKFVDLKASVRRDLDVQLLQPETLCIGRASHCHQDPIECERDVLPVVFADQHVFTAAVVDRRGLVPGAYGNPLGGEALGQMCRDIRVLAGQQPRCHLDLGDLTAETGEGLAEFAADTATTEHEQALR